AHQRVLQRVLERVAHVQGAGDVRRRQQDDVRFALARGLEHAAGLPLRVEAGFEGGRVVAGCQCHHMSYLLSSIPRALYAFQRSRRGSRAAGSAGTTSSTRSKLPSTTASRRLITSGRIGTSISGVAISTGV